MTLPLWLSVSLTAIIRYFLVIIGSFMVARGYWNAEVADTFITGATADLLGWLLMILPILYAIIRKRWDLDTLVNALRSPQNMTKADVEHMDPPPPDVIQRLIARPTDGGF